MRRPAAATSLGDRPGVHFRLLVGVDVIISISTISSTIALILGSMLSFVFLLSLLLLSSLSFV